MEWVKKEGERVGRAKSTRGENETVTHIISDGYVSRGSLISSRKTRSKFLTKSVSSVSRERHYPTYGLELYS